VVCAGSFWIAYTDKKEDEIFLINKEIQMGSVANCTVIHEEGLPNI
jgi:hypothetical protein